MPRHSKIWISAAACFSLSGLAYGQQPPAPNPDAPPAAQPQAAPAPACPPGSTAVYAVPANAPPCCPPAAAPMPETKPEARYSPRDFSVTAGGGVGNFSYHQLSTNRDFAVLSSGVTVAPTDVRADMWSAEIRAGYAF